MLTFKDYQYVYNCADQITKTLVSKEMRINAGPGICIYGFNKFKCQNVSISIYKNDNPATIHLGEYYAKFMSTKPDVTSLIYTFDEVIKSFGHLFKHNKYRRRLDEGNHVHILYNYLSGNVRYMNFEKSYVNPAYINISHRNANI